MSREIKFRARTVITGSWIYFSLRDLEQGFVKTRFIWDTVCQFTGLKDKSGKEIWESDNLKTEIATYAVCWDNSYGRWALKDTIRNLNPPLWHYAKTSEVIGNIYEQPELLQEKK